jgi:hypothetical protein
LANRLEFHGKTSHWEVETPEHPADDLRWKKKHAQLADFSCTIRKIGEIDDADWMANFHKKPMNGSLSNKVSLRQENESTNESGRFETG